MKYTPYLIIGAFFMIDFFIRKGAKAKAIEQTEEDNHTTLDIILAFAIILISAEAFGYFHIGTFNRTTIAIIGIVCMLSGLGLRIYSILKLKSSYTRVLKTLENQKLNTQGIYSYIRHPGYLGTILIWIFFGLALENYLVCLIAVPSILVVYIRRIESEEKMLSEKFKLQYLNYKKTSWKLVPYVW